MTFILILFLLVYYYIYFNKEYIAEPDNNQESGFENLNLNQLFNMITTTKKFSKRNWEKIQARNYKSNGKSEDFG